jgi:hypothetical protein
MASEFGIDIDDLTILSRLGRGGMASVYLAREEGLGRLVAVKVIDEKLDGDPGFLRRFEREARTAASLTHPNIVPTYRYGRTADGRPFLSMAFLDGGSLRDRLRKRGPLPVDEALAVTRQVASALALAHGRNVIHRDLKPDNILFQGDTAYLSDFGIAKLTDATALTGTGMNPGTVRYFSPEQAKELPLDARSDIYSLGVVLYEALTGALPIDAGTVPTLMMRIAFEAPARLPEALRGLQPFLDVLLAKEPDDRLASCSEVVAVVQAMERNWLRGHDLDRITDGIAMAPRADRAAPAAGDDATLMMPGSAAQPGAQPAGSTSFSDLGAATPGTKAASQRAAGVGPAASGVAPQQPPVQAPAPANAPSAPAPAPAAQAAPQAVAQAVSQAAAGQPAPAPPMQGGRQVAVAVVCTALVAAGAWFASEQGAFDAADGQPAPPVEDVRVTEVADAGAATPGAGAATPGAGAATPGAGAATDIDDAAPASGGAETGTASATGAPSDAAAASAAAPARAGAASAEATAQAASTAAAAAEPTAPGSAGRSAANDAAQPVTPPRRAAPPPELAGDWTGHFEQAGNRVDFQMTLVGNGGRYGGRSTEPNTMGSGGKQFLYADITLRVDSSGQVQFTKTYDGTGGQTHSVTYAGTYDAGNGQIAGTWRIDDTSGAFAMSRQ